MEEFEDIEEQNDASRVIQNTPRKQNIESVAQDQISRFSVITAEYKYAQQQKEEENFSITDFDQEEPSSEQIVPDHIGQAQPKKAYFANEQPDFL